MPELNEHDLNLCLYFTTNSLARKLSSIAEEEFMITGLSASHALLLLTVVKNPGITQNELCGIMNFNPSTITRFLDKLSHRRFVRRETSGKFSKIYATSIGKQKEEIIEKAWRNVYNNYNSLIDKKTAEKLTESISEAIKMTQKG